MDPIIIQSINRNPSGWTAVVQIGEEDDTATHHVVSIDDDYFEELTEGMADIDVLVEQSFKYLLEREPKESIMRNFDLDVIGQYFDDYEEQIRDRLMKE